MVLNTTVYNSSAPGIPLLAIHGVQGHSKRWARFASRFENRVIIAVDLRGHGHSTFNAPWSLTQHLNDLVATVAAQPHLAGGQFDVIGHSFGGFLSLWLCSRLASRIRSLVLLDPAFLFTGEFAAEYAQPYVSGTTFGTREDATKSRMLALESGYRVREGYMTEQNHILRLHPDVEDDVRENLEEFTVDGVTRYRFRWSPAAVICALSELCTGLPDLAPSDRPKVLLLAATKAEFVKEPQIEALKNFAGAENLRIETLECGHMVTWEKLSETCEVVELFYESLDS
ncbi:Alpha/Beta hydrolase protein [Cladochytrium replicatum]|nr:Alpha/Beta hydrolase protein [Cladochytrium replicatum]